MPEERDPQGSRLGAWVDDLQAGGRYCFTRDELEGWAGRSEVAVDAALRRLKQRQRIQTLRRGVHVVVPIEYRVAGCPPASWFLDDLMRFLGQPYYVGILGSAALHGAAHQQPMRLQVVTDRPTRSVRAGRVLVEFHERVGLGTAKVETVATETGAMRVATPETTAFDLVHFQAAAGHLDQVVTVLGELVERLRVPELVACSRTQPAPDGQRLGYLLERLGHRQLAVAIAEGLGQQRLRSVVLVPRRASGRAKPDARWRVVPNWTLRIDP